MRPWVLASVLLWSVSCVEPGTALEWPNEAFEVRLLVHERPGGSLYAEVLPASATLALTPETRSFLLLLRSDDLEAIHPLIDPLRISEVRLESPDPVCRFGYRGSEDRVFGPVPDATSVFSIDLEGGRFVPTEAGERRALTDAIALSMPFVAQRPDLALGVHNFGASSRVTMDGWVAEGEPRFLQPGEMSSPYHKLYDAQAIGPDHALIAHETALFLFSRGAPPLATDEDLPVLRNAALPDFGRQDWAFSSFAVLPEEVTPGARRVVVASYTNEVEPQRSRFTWLDVFTDPPRIEVVTATTVRGAATFFAAIVDLEGRALFLMREDAEGLPINERKTLYVAGPRPLGTRTLSKPDESFAAVGVTPLPGAPHIVAFEDGRLEVTDLTTAGPPRYRTRVSPPIYRSPAALSSIMEPDGLRILWAGEQGDYLWVDAERDVWTRPRLVADPETEGAAGCISAPSADACGFATPGIELRDAILDRSPGGQPYSVQIPQLCAHVLIGDPRGYLTSTKVTDLVRPYRVLERLRSGASEALKLISNDQGELYEIELP